MGELERCGNQFKDIFKDKYEGVIFAEIEFESVEIANNFEFPKWFGKEISENITNAEMATKDLKPLIKEIINKS